MKSQLKVVRQLDEIAADYRECLRSEENSRERRGGLLKEAYRQFSDQKSFLAWAKAEFGIGKSEVYVCMGDLEAERGRVRDRVAKHRDLSGVTDKSRTPFVRNVTDKSEQGGTVVAEDPTEDTPLRENDPRAPLATATKPGLYNEMINSWEACLTAFHEATPAQRKAFKQSVKRHSKDLLSFFAEREREKRSAKVVRDNSPLGKIDDDYYSDITEFEESPVGWSNRAESAATMAVYAPIETCPRTKAMLARVRKVRKAWQHLEDHLEQPEGNERTSGVEPPTEFI